MSHIFQQSGSSDSSSSSGDDGGSSGLGIITSVLGASSGVNKNSFLLLV